MNKAILVIDMPNKCWDCPCCEIWEAIPSIEECTCNLRNIIVDKYNKPDWCPLKPVPEKIDVPDWDDDIKAKNKNAEEVGMYMYDRGYYRGYNICIDKILGN